MPPKRITPIAVTEPPPRTLPVETVLAQEDVNDPNVAEYMNRVGQEWDKMTAADMEGFFRKGFSGKSKATESDIRAAIDLYTKKGYVRDPNCEQKDLYKNECWETRKRAEKLGWVEPRERLASPKAQSKQVTARKRVAQDGKLITVKKYQRCKRGNKPDCK